MLDRISEIASDGEGRVGHGTRDLRSTIADPATTDPALPDARRDQVDTGIHVHPVASSIPYTVARERRRGGHPVRDDQSAIAVPQFHPAQPDGCLDHRLSVTQCTRVEAAINSDPGNAGSESGHWRRDIQASIVALATVPPQGGVREDQEPAVDQSRRASLAKFRKPRGVRGAVGPKTPDTHALAADSVNAHEIGGDAEGRVGQDEDDALQRRADAATMMPGYGESGVGHLPFDAQTATADPAIIAEIREQWRRRQAWHRAEKSLTLQAKALCRRLAVDGDKDEADVIYRASQGDGSHDMADVALAAIFPLTEARDGVEKHRLLVEARLRKLAKTLPVAPWVLSMRGASLNSLAAVVGEAGDIGAFPYTNPAKLWKRMGLAVMPDGTRQRRVSGEEGVEHGYSPKRRSVMWNIGGSLIGGLGRGPRLAPDENPDVIETLSPLQRLFVKRIRYEAERDPSHARPVTKAGKESFSKHAAARAKRYVEKRFLLLLWREWRRAIQVEASNVLVPAAEPFREAAE